MTISELPVNALANTTATRKAIEWVSSVLKKSLHPRDIPPP
jgi:hypothetical protein